VNFHERRRNSAAVLFELAEWRGCHGTSFLRRLPLRGFAGIVRGIMTALRFILLLAGALTFAGSHAFAHGDVHERINQLTQQITQTPSNALLFFQRAELYRVDQDYTNALVDLDRVAQLDPKIARVDFCRGRVQFEANRPQAALPPLNSYLAGKPKDAEAYTTRARVLARLGQHKPAVEDYTTAIGLSTSSPELFIERAESWRAQGKAEEAIRGLDEGIRKMGPLVTLELPAIDLEVSLKRYDAAVARIDTVTTRLQRKETWLLRRAEILRQAGRESDARSNYQEALAAIQRLPPTHRNTRATLDLEGRIRAALGTNALPSGSKTP
jgi:tetratricopeptide (TPR) repeat protein